MVESAISKQGTHAEAVDNIDSSDHNMTTDLMNDFVCSDSFRSGAVAIVGRPNVGKSTLLNCLIGQKISIVSKKPQTTRHVVRGIRTDDDAQYVFVDTPGWQTRHSNRLTQAMNQSIDNTFAGVDVVLFVIDDRFLSRMDMAMIQRLPRNLPVIAAVNKIDTLSDKSVLLPALAALDAAFPFRAIVPVSAANGLQAEHLLSELKKSLPVQPPIYELEALTDQNERFFAAEFLREKIFRLTGDEVPYLTGVTIEQFVVEGAVRRIAATVFVDRRAHKQILIGKDGERMKRIASEARADMEALFDGPVFLQVWVKIKAGWADHPGIVADLMSL